jgi:hypothetical protein
LSGHEYPHCHVDRNSQSEEQRHQDGDDSHGSRSHTEATGDSAAHSAEQRAL